MSEMRRATQEAIGRMVAETVTMLSFAGEQAVNEARMAHTYRDQTGNLTSSIGYAVIVDGNPVEVGDFNPVLTADKGMETGREYAISLASEFPQGITLVVVAGMKYAKYVAAKGYNVLDSSELLARRIVPELLKDLDTL